MDSGTKIIKFVDDECFGMKFNQLDACKRCWLRFACSIKQKHYEKNKLLEQNNKKTKSKPKKKIKK